MAEPFVFHARATSLQHAPRRLGWSGPPRKETAMTTVKYCLIVGLGLAFPLASAHADDASYCAALGASYREYVGAVQADANAAAAMSQCSAGNTAAGIPTLEKILTDNKVKLPARN